MLYQAMVDLIGAVPYGFEPLVYVLCVPVLIFILSQTFAILWALLNFLGGK